jgi:hypothetical protein
LAGPDADFASGRQRDFGPPPAILADAGGLLSVVGFYMLLFLIGRPLFLVILSTTVQAR